MTTEAAQSAPSGGIFDLQGLEFLKDQAEPGGVNMNPDNSPTDQGSPQAPVVPEPVDPAITAAQPEAEAPGVQTPAGGEAGDKLWAKKYQTPEAMEQAYVEAQRALTQSFQDRAESNRQVEALQQQVSQLVPMVQQTWLQANPEYAEQYAQQQAIAPLVEQQVAPIRQELQSAHEQQLSAATVQHFYATHPDVAPNSAEDQAVLQSMQDLDLNLRPDTLEIAYEAAKDPGLRQVLKANPTFIDTDEGMAMARKLARIPDPSQVVAGAQQQGLAQAQASDPAAARAVAFVEGATSGSPQSGAPGPRPNDVWEETVRAYRDGQNASAFGF